MLVPTTAEVSSAPQPKWGLDGGSPTRHVHLDTKRSVRGRLRDPSGADETKNNERDEGRCGSTPHVHQESSCHNTCRTRPDVRRSTAQEPVQSAGAHGPTHNASKKRVSVVGSSAIVREARLRPVFRLRFHRKFSINIRSRLSIVCLVVHSRATRDRRRSVEFLPPS